MKYSQFNSLVMDKTEALRQIFPLSMFILDHYVRLLLYGQKDPIYQHIGYLRQAKYFGKMVDLVSRVGAPYQPKSHGGKILISNTLVLAFEPMIQDLVNKKCEETYHFFGLARYNPRINKQGLGYFSLYAPLFMPNWTGLVGEALKVVLELEKNNFKADFSDLENATEELVKRLSDKLAKSCVRHVIALRDFFWYEAALILACRRAGIGYHVIAHGYPHSDPDQAESIGFLPFRGDYLYCLHENSRRLLAPYLTRGECSSVQSSAPRPRSCGSGILFISSDVEEARILDGSFRLRVYQQMRKAAVASGRQVVVRFREDENLKQKIPEARAFGFHTKVKTDCPLEQDLADAKIVFGFQSTALFLSSEAGRPTYQTGKYGVDIPGVEQIEPEEILSVIDGSERFSHSREARAAKFSEVFWANVSGAVTREAACSMENRS